MILKPLKFRPTYTQMRCIGDSRVRAVVWTVRAIMRERRRGDLGDG